MSNDNIYAAQTEVPSSSQPHPGRFTPPPVQPVYYQQPERRGGCASFFLKTVGIAALVLVICFFGLLLLGVMVGAMAASMEQVASIAGEKPLTEKFVLGSKEASAKIAVIEVAGMIAGGEDTFVSKQIKTVLKDDNVRAVVLRIESPGGTMAGSDYYHHLLKKIKTNRKIPLVVSMGTMAASGGYYLAAAGDEIFAEQSTITGSIGVIVSLYNGKDLLDKIGVASNPIISGPHKTMGSFSKPLTDEEKAIWQTLVDDSFERFKTVIKEGRKTFAAEPEKLDKLATGRIFTANEAKANGLIDEIGFLEDAIKKAMTLAGLNEEDSKVIKYKPKLDFIETLLEGKANKQLLSAETLTELTTPKVLLLCPYTVPVE
ncbi:MAG: signal peptide peptidase SppA [Planctomycetaceae bacterium]|jgi:protease-4|nr:signal peptide peptidase SppA [Planctomycetaceae bacterium]